MSAILSIIPWSWLITALTVAGAAVTVFFHKKSADNKVAAVTAKADTDVAAASLVRDAAVVDAAKVREVTAKANDAAAQEGLAAAQERTNVEVETAASTRVDNDQWMRDNGFIKPADTTGAESVGRGAGSAGTDPNR